MSAGPSSGPSIRMYDAGTNPLIPYWFTQCSQPSTSASTSTWSTKWKKLAWLSWSAKGLLQGGTTLQSLHAHFIYLRFEQLVHAVTRCTSWDQLRDLHKALCAMLPLHIVARVAWDYMSTYFLHWMYLSSMSIRIRGKDLGSSWIPDKRFCKSWVLPSS